MHLLYLGQNFGESKVLILALNRSLLNRVFRDLQQKLTGADYPAAGRDLNNRPAITGNSRHLLGDSYVYPCAILA